MAGFALNPDFEYAAVTRLKGVISGDAGIGLQGFQGLGQVQDQGFCIRILGDGVGQLIDTFFIHEHMEVFLKCAHGGFGVVLIAIGCDDLLGLLRTVSQQGGGCILFGSFSGGFLAFLGFRVRIFFHGLCFLIFRFRSTRERHGGRS